MTEAAAAVSGQSPNLERLDAVLAKLPRPTPLRGMVQTARAGVLATARDPGPAIAAVEDALRLLPDDPRPKLVAAYIFTFSGAPQRAADLWMQASRESPDFARESGRHEMEALVGRLRDVGDRARADRLRSRLGEIGFSSALAPERSAAALARTREAMRDKLEPQALASVTAISDPDDLLTLYLDRRYEVLWPRIAEWADPDLNGQSQRYLEELRSEWTAGDNFETAVPYTRALASMDAFDAVIGLFLPMFDRLDPERNNDGIEYLAPVVARSLSRLGRSSDARALLARAEAVMPPDDMGNALNFEGAYLTLAYNEADWPQVIARADAFLIRAKALGGNVNRSATLSVLSKRACAAWRLGRTDEAQQAMAEVLLAQATIPSAALELHLCRGDAAAARALIVARLDDEATRGMALRFVQPVLDKVLTPMERLQKPVAREVRTASEVVVAANRVGRVLLQPIAATLPKSFDPFRSSPRAKPISPGEA